MKDAAFESIQIRDSSLAERTAEQISKLIVEQHLTCEDRLPSEFELAELLKGRYENHHFEEEIVDGDVHFSYQIREGKATTRNAIRLLSVMGYEASLIREAEAMSERFLNEGVWRLKA